MTKIAWEHKFAVVTTSLVAEAPRDVPYHAFSCAWEEQVAKTFMNSTV